MLTVLLLVHLLCHCVGIYTCLPLTSCNCFVSAVDDFYGNVVSAVGVEQAAT